MGPAGGQFDAALSAFYEGGIRPVSIALNNASKINRDDFVQAVG